MIRKTTILAVFLALYASCQTQRDFGVRVIQPPDIPVPRGMVLSTHLHESNSVERGEYRHADLVYRGPNAPMAIGAYLKDRMPQHAYELVSQEKTDDQTEEFVFRRGQYVATCTVKKLPKQSELRIQLRTKPNNL